MSIAVQVTCSFFDQVVEDSITPNGRKVVLGGTQALAIPRPAGLPYLAELTWKSPTHIIVRDGHGQKQELIGNGVVVVQEGPLRLECRLVRRFRLRRVASMATIATTTLSAMLLTILIGGIGLVTQTHMAVNQTWCETWPGEVMPPEKIPVVRELFYRCHQPAQQGGGGQASEAGRQGAQDRLAEYMERILKEDANDKSDGRLAQGDRQFGERERQDDKIYLPAGDKGSFDKMGGAKNVGLRPVRTETRKQEEVKQAPKKRHNLLVAENGTPIQMPVDPDDALTDADEADETEDQVEDPAELLERQEDREGWGFKDWYDQSDQQLDDLRIDAMKNLADRILKIDPNDSEALAMMAYYQYLDEDMKGAEKTYDRYIELNPDDPAGYNNKALVYKRLGQYEREEQLYEIALALSPDDKTALNNLAVNYGHQRRFDEAKAVLDQLEVVDPGEPYADLHRAKVYAEQGDDERAIAYLEKALQGMKHLNTLHHIEFRQDIRLDPSFDRLRKTRAFRSTLWRYYGDDTPLPE